MSEKILVTKVAGNAANLPPLVAELKSKYEGIVVKLKACNDDGNKLSAELKKDLDEFDGQKAGIVKLREAATASGATNVEI